MKKKMTGIVCLAMATALSASSLAACGGGANDPSTIRFWVYGQDTHIDMYTQLKNKFNETYGKSHDINVEIAMKPNGSYAQLIETSATSKSGPDVFLVEDANIKSWIIGDYFCPIGEYLDAVTDVDLGDISEAAVKRLRYDVKTNTSNPDDPLYGLPLDSQPSALYYNTVMFEKAGIKVISVDEEDLEKWNNNEIADRNGKKKSDYGITIDVPAKGFYRENPYFEGEESTGWSVPANNEAMIFNNRIPMNWDEYDDISMLFTATYNPSSGNSKITPYGSTYGNYTEWWYMYAWSIGADCLTDLSADGSGDWNFSLLDDSKNYIVLSDSYTGETTGAVYKKGETLSFRDKMDVTATETIVPDDNGNYKHSDGKAIVVKDSVKTAATGEGAVLGELPSARTAQKKHVKLSVAPTQSNIEGEKGLGVGPHPNTFSNRTPQNYFWSGNIAMLTALSSYIFVFEEQAEARSDFDFDVAPLPVYKQYEDPSDPVCDDVVIAGKTEVGHANAYSMVVRSGSEKKEKAAAFIKWMAGLEAQEYRAEMGYFPTQASLVDKFKIEGDLSNKNFSLFAKAVSYQTPGDWWYMPDYPRS